MTAPLQRHHQRFADRNTFLFALLGVVSLGAEFERVVTQKPAEEPSSPRRGAKADLGVYLLLGLASLRNTATRLLAGWAVAAPPPAVKAAREHRPVEGLFR